ncbi:MAG: ABC transporter ATP-binding protein [Pseudomonadota bacterium]
MSTSSSDLQPAVARPAWRAAGQPILDVRGLKKTYGGGGLFGRRRAGSFGLNASFSIAEPAIVGVMGPNGSGKTTLFELLAGSNVPTGGQVLCAGQDVHRIKYRQRDRMVIHYHQSYQVRRFRKTLPNFMLNRAPSDYPLVHIFDEPQFSVQDGYIGFMLDFFQTLRAQGRVVLLCVHPNEPFHLDIMRSACERYLFVQKGQVAQLPDYRALHAHPGVREYLGALADL